MYGNETAGGASALALTGAATGSEVLWALGLIFAGIAIYALARKNSKHKP